MIQADKAIAQHDFQSPTGATSKPVNTSKASKPKIAEAVRRLQGMGHLHCEIGDTDFRLTWEPTFRDLTDSEIDLALDEALRFTGFLKPGHLLEWGRKIDGMPSDLAGYLEACHYPQKRTFSHPGLFWVANQTGWHEIKTQPQDRVFPRWKKFYDEMVAQVRAGKVFEAPAQVEALPEKVTVPSDNNSPGYRAFLELKASLHQQVAEGA